ncbi:MAG: UDP-N-acetylenolpyruvoylglucosamine reductase [Candidatus Woesebacteria bacterium GW2011_GWB1_38_5b]|uniref:UDP-N-acetylenolpyruvoylglucosamine reductase n=1 Tax=Candidatus Woesebacteria bacterium GW2011_GWB1_38_5b TaxID=1618569 RepID=A0A0G0K788_9BACT|nr:MAG: UDP-N-acetylenolpyruvoylglucosamine reductase [Candidatus Woesebacteria bacterium GW2011_GWB1_38_5b]OGH47543.1 MAG: UDP-N-acetylenolpyruvoylglucosamine reductase [Candidatus Levybacteria bacterium RIFCSPLOWO2_01_FULL_39_10]
MILKTNVPLKKYSHIRIGGPATLFSEFKSEEELIEILKHWREENGELDNVLVLGDGTNILFSDRGFSGLVIKNSIDFIKKEKDCIEVGAGTKVSRLVEYYIGNSLSGFEWAGGLPGTVGGAVRGNAGAFGGETKDILISARCINIKSLKKTTLTNNKCNFSYRNSFFKSNAGKDEIILSVRFSFKKGDADTIRLLTQEKIDYRIEKHPLDYPNLGSIFKNVPVENVSKRVLSEFGKNIKKDPFPVIPAVKFLVGSGLKGKTIGGAKVSEKHPNYIVNDKNAKAKDVLSLIKQVKEKVKEKYKVVLDEEITIVGN